MCSSDFFMCVCVCGGQETWAHEADNVLVQLPALDAAEVARKGKRVGVGRQRPHHAHAPAVPASLVGLLHLTRGLGGEKRKTRKKGQEKRQGKKNKKNQKKGKKKRQEIRARKKARKRE